MRRNHRRVHLVGPRWVFTLAPVLLAASWMGAYQLGRLHGAETKKRAPEAAAGVDPVREEPRVEAAEVAPASEPASAASPEQAEATAVQGPARVSPEAPAFVSEVDLGDRGTWYRLRLGRHRTRREARAAARGWAERLDEAPLVVEYP